MAQFKIITPNNLDALIKLIKTDLKGKVNVQEGYGLVQNTEIEKLKGIQAQATKNQTDAYLLDRANHTGTQSADTIVDGTENKVLTKALHDKLEALYQTVIDDNLTSTAADHALSANQGKALKALIDAANAAITKIDANGDGIVNNAEDAKKLGGQLPAHYENVLTAIKVNGEAQEIAPDKSVDIVVPTNNNQLTNGAGYQNAAQVEAAITQKGYQTAQQVQTAIEAAKHFKREIVESLPEVGTAKEDVIYLVKSASATGGNNAYDEFIVVEGKWEKIGDTRVDLTGYVKETDIVEMTEQEIQTIWGSVTV